MQDVCHEEVLTTLVGAILLRIAGHWDFHEDRTQTGTSRPVAIGSTPCILDLTLDTCWNKTPTLRQFQVDIIVALMENDTWRLLEAESSYMDIMELTLGLLEDPQTQELECCKILGVVSLALQIPGLVSSRLQAHRPQSVTPFSRREESEQSQEGVHFKLAALAFPSVLAKLDDKSESVRLKAVETLGDFLPLVQPGGTDEDLTEDGAVTSAALNSSRYPKPSLKCNHTPVDDCMDWIWVVGNSDVHRGWADLDNAKNTPTSLKTHPTEVAQVRF